ncbi:MAG TPA: DUF4157 domain-containing protein, partial [Steroidobacteraceae bacterium]|nr:DUF4157 domain-containing protein [Steroidobacteraceae bacterium]
METRFGVSFGDVRVHDDARANESATGLAAKAYTHGNDIVFAAHRFAPHTTSGRRLLAHELAHVVQQRRGGSPPVLDSQAPHEQSADRAADAAVQGTAAVNVAGATGVGVACDKDEDEEKKRKGQASMTAITQRPKRSPKLDLPVHVINDPNKGKGTLAETTVPFALYSGPDWNHLGGGEETSSSRTSLARETDFGPTAGLDFLVENRNTGRLVIGEQKAVDKQTFENATAITVNLEKNVAQAKLKLQQKIDNGEVHPEEVVHLQEIIAKLDATQRVLEKGSGELPSGVVFELTNISGEGKKIGKGYVDLLGQKYGKDPTFMDHLLSRTFVRDPALAKEQGRAAGGARGTDADPDIVPAQELLTDSAKDEMARRRAGKTEKQWEKDKARQRADDENAQREALKAQTKAKREQRAADERKARDEAKQLGDQARQERLKQLQDERARSGEPEPTTKRKRQQADKKQEREAAQAGKKTEKESFDAFKARRKQQEQAERNKRIADEQARRQQRESEQQAREQRAAQEKQANQERQSAADKARQSGALENPQALKNMNDEARKKYQSEQRESRLGKAAHLANQGAAGMRAYDAYDDAVKSGKGQLEAGYDAVKTYLDNTNPVLGAIATAQSRQQKDEKGQQYYGDDAVDAWLGTIGETGAGYIVPGKGWDQLLNAGANLFDAVDDHRNKGRDPNDPAAKQASARTGVDLAAELTPSRMFSTVVGGGSRAWYDLARAAKGDTKGVDKFGEDAVRGKLGSIIQPWAMAADFVGNLGGNDAGTALNKTLKKTEGTTLKKIGDASGDAMYELGQSKEAKSGKYGESVQGISMMLGMTSDMIAGDSFEKALNKAADAGKGSVADKVGSAMGDAAFATVEKGKEIYYEDIPAAKKKAA